MRHLGSYDDGVVSLEEEDPEETEEIEKEKWKEKEKQRKEAEKNKPRKAEQNGVGVPGLNLRTRRYGWSDRQGVKCEEWRPLGLRETGAEFAGVIEKRLKCKG